MFCGIVRLMQISVTNIQVESDRRYRVLVLLERSDKPTNWKLYCIRCQMPVLELINTNVVALTDMVDMEEVDNALIGVRCDGRFEGGRCSLWYYTKLVNNGA